MNLPQLDPNSIENLESIFTWVWSTYGKEIVAKATSNTWRVAKRRSAARRYAQKVKKLYGTMQIFGQPEPVLLENVFTRVHLLDKPTALRRFGIDQLRERFTDLGFQSGG